MFRITLATLLLATLPCLAQSSETLVQQDTPSAGQTLKLQGARSPFSLFDLSRFHMTQSYGISFFSSGGQSNTIAMYLNRVDYSFTDNLHLSVKLGWLHQPQAALGFSESTVSSRIYPAVGLDWWPSDKFHLQFNFETLAPYGYDYQRNFFDYPYWDSESRYERIKAREQQQ